MSQFPSLKPSSRSFTPGSLPIESFQSLSGKETRVILGDTMHGHTLSLEYQNIQEADVRLVTDHWYGQQGTALSFTLPRNLWAGWEDFSSAIAGNPTWRYAGQPEIEAVSPGIMNVSVELVSLA